MTRRREQGLCRGIQLDRPDGPIGIFAVPAGHHRIVSRNALNRVSASRPWGIILHPVLEDLLIQEVGPKRYCSPLPEETFALRIKGSTSGREDPREAIDLGKF